jgi:hypothetical protein
VNLLENVITAIQATLDDCMILIMPGGSDIVVRLVDGMFEARILQEAPAHHAYEIRDRTSDQVIARGHADSIAGALEVCGPLIMRLNQLRPAPRMAA